MDSLSTELLYEINELLPRHAISQLCRVNRRCCADLQPLLFRLHGYPNDWNGPSAVFWAVNIANASDCASQTLALTVLAKVEAFCRIGPGDLDRSFSRRNCDVDVWTVRRSRCKSPLYGDRTKEWPAEVGRHASFNPLHLAAYKGLDSIVAWLLAHGADVNALIEATPHNALVPAVVANRASTALLLLAHGANRAIDMSYNGFAFDNSGRPRYTSWYKPAVTTLAAALGYEAMAEKLMDSGFVPAAGPSEMLYIYAQNGHSRPAFVANLVHRGAEASPRMFLHLVNKDRYNWSKLPLALLEAMPLDSPFLTQTGTSTFPQQTVREITESFQREFYFTDFHENHYDREYFTTDIGLVQRALRRLLMFRGVDIDTCGRSLWRQSSYQAPDYALIRNLLPPFLEAGMDVQCMRKDGCQDEFLGAASIRKVPDDLLELASRYGCAQCTNSVAMQLDVVSLLLQHGALISAATREQALRDHPIGPSAYTTVGRSGWSVQLCNTFLEHCCSTPEEKQREDMRDFLAFYREKTKRVSIANMANIPGTGVSH
ncbi:ectomycorrhiza-induced ankyrin-domain nacht-domain containing protein [Grosmannia clavigera kw1407]|uniref:Ectomycorrhiza-induced ankyrin-domain nacht-domain containing protein n=1 Tax=Grosmannia clavigera (strain kw1407 / UAMH 11150) TaxID=655863 RepID=F0XKW8_GROCL|nr:ectomycorrhiza-induced ankyrin-domain nacht-domain containing protein [Grosmannia clavigera kw1407]EFX01639.1 ectomycorrhiza-induced ankyrin-domain nacht-domain containing protein [Grosmannia clavigera kw1407]